MTKNISEDAMDLKHHGALKRLHGKRFIALVAIVACLLFVTLGYVFFNTFVKKTGDDANVNTATATSHDGPEHGDIFYDMSEFIVNLIPTDSQQHYLKMIITLHLSSQQEKEIINANIAIIQDSLYIFLKELRAMDFTGSGATLRLKEELMKRINKAAYPVEVKDVLFKEILVD